jgi:hypothetical protein
MVITPMNAAGAAPGPLNVEPSAAAWYVDCHRGGSALGKARLFSPPCLAGLVRV